MKKSGIVALVSTACLGAAIGTVVLVSNLDKNDADQVTTEIASQSDAVEDQDDVSTEEQVSATEKNGTTTEVAEATEQAQGEDEQTLTENTKATEEKESKKDDTKPSTTSASTTEKPSATTGKPSTTQEQAPEKPKPSTTSAPITEKPSVTTEKPSTTQEQAPEKPKPSTTSTPTTEATTTEKQKVWHEPVYKTVTKEVPIYKDVEITRTVYCEKCNNCGQLLFGQDDCSNHMFSTPECRSYSSYQYEEGTGEYQTVIWGLETVEEQVLVKEGYWDYE